MPIQHARRFSRRRFLGGVTLAGMAGLLGVPPRPVAAEPPPETTRLRVVTAPRHLSAPHSYVAEEFLLRGEGFTEVQYVDLRGSSASTRRPPPGEIDFGSNFIGPTLTRLEAGDPARAPVGDSTSAASSCSRTSRSAPSAS